MTNGFRVEPGSWDQLLHGSLPFEQQERVASLD